MSHKVLDKSSKKMLQKNKTQDKDIHTLAVLLQKFKKCVLHRNTKSEENNVKHEKNNDSLCQTRANVKSLKKGTFGI